CGGSPKIFPIFSLFGGLWVGRAGAAFAGGKKNPGVLGGEALRRGGVRKTGRGDTVWPPPAGEGRGQGREQTGHVRSGAPRPCSAPTGARGARGRVLRS